MIAITREISPNINRCELTYLARQPIDIGRARLQHAAYEGCLRSLGCEVVRVPAAPDLPDSIFVEETCVVLPELAIITRPGVESRRSETAAVAEILGCYRELRAIEGPATLDGGDVLRVGRNVFIGLSRRTNHAAV